MTSSVIRKYVLAALCGAAIVGIGQTAQAATWDITGGVINFAPPNYGIAPNQNNVLNQGVLGNAHVFDELNGTSIYAGSQLQTTFITAYDVTWTYLGSESDNTLRFTGPGVAGFDETNANNNCLIGCAAGGQGGPVVMGSATNQTAVQPVFDFTDQNDGSHANNGLNPLPPGIGDPQPGDPNFLMSYAEFRNGAFGLGWYLTLSVTDYVVIGLNDSGFADDNHDDYTMVGFIQESATTPIPGALPLFASVLGGGFLFRRLRNRRQAKAAA